MLWTCVWPGASSVQLLKRWAHFPLESLQQWTWIGQSIPVSSLLSRRSHYTQPVALFYLFIYWRWNLLKPHTHTQTHMCTHTHELINEYMFFVNKRTQRGMLHHFPCNSLEWVPRSLVASFVEWALWQLLTSQSFYTWLFCKWLTEASRTFQILDKWGITIYIDLSAHQLHPVSTLVIWICPALETQAVTTLPFFGFSPLQKGRGSAGRSPASVVSFPLIHFCLDGSLSLATCICISVLASFFDGSDKLPWSLRK